MKKTFLLLSVFSFALNSWGAVSFTSAEVKVHQEKVKTIVTVAAQCLDRIYDDHVDFHGRWSVSRYYGDRRQDYSTRQGLIQALRKYNAPEHLVDELVPTSCVGLTMKCLSEGFAATGTKATWDKIYKELAVGQKFDGTDLQRMLQQLGWKVLYWNPDPTSNARWDAEDLALNPLKPGAVWNPVWGGHAYRYNQVLKKGTYYDVKVDDAKTLVGFKDAQPLAFKKAPFFIGTAHAGYHVFPGSFGTIIEAHSMRNLNSIDNLETSPFNPLATGGGPRWTKTERYRSGIMAIPPGF
jgi:hypothetical protein